MLGLIVVDGEHDSSYKQQDDVLQCARYGRLRASLANAKVILASATPSLETWNTAKSGKYKRFNLTKDTDPLFCQILKSLI